MKNVCGLACNDTYLHRSVKDNDTESKFNTKFEFSVSSAFLFLKGEVSLPFLLS